jgi:V/A-type H+-transporting ATPase subunit I
MLVTMRRIQLMAPRDQADAVLRTIHRAGTVQLTPFAPVSGLEAAVFSSGGPGGPAARLEPLLAEAVALAEGLGVGTAPSGAVHELWLVDEPGLVERARALDPVRMRLAALQATRERLASDAARHESLRHVIDALRPIVGRLPTLRGYASTAVVISARYRAMLPELQVELERMTEGRCEILAAEIGDDRIAALLLYPAAHAEAVRTLLGGRDLDELPLPEELTGLPFDQLTRQLDERVRRTAADEAATDLAIRELADRHGGQVAALATVLADRLDEARALGEAAASDHLVLFDGWVPAARLDELRARLAAEVGPQVIIEEREPTREERATAPVAIENPRLLQAFAPLTSFVSLPRYGTLDPTPIFAASFPIFVGLMVGDVGYGLVLLGLLVLARRRWRHAAWMATITPIATLAALATVAFGILYGEWFGTTGHDLLGIEPLLFDRREAVTEFLLIALAIGAGQIAIGLALGIVNALLRHQAHELAARIGLLATLTATLVLLGWLAGFVPATGGHLALVVLAGALGVLIASIGLAGPIEAVGMLGNVLSYARLMAIGMASVMLAVVANRLGGVAGNVVIGFFVAAVLHAVNLVLGFFDSSVQGLRLHYVEFFSKFVEPGGTRYRPFRSALDPALTSGTPPAAVAPQGGV